MQQLGLQLEGELADLIQEERASSSGHEEPLALLACVSECSPAHAEEFTLGQSGRERRAVELNEGMRPPLTVVVDEAGKDALAGARLARDEHRAAAPGGASRKVEDTTHRCALGDDGLRRVRRRQGRA